MLYKYAYIYIEREREREREVGEIKSQFFIGMDTIKCRPFVVLKIL